jgi:hypothetical protein
VSFTSPAFTEKLDELVETLAAREVQPTEAGQILQTLRQAYTDFDKLLSRRFPRLSAAQQQMLMQLLQEAQAREFAPLFQQWSHSQDLPIASRVRAMTTLAQWGAAVDEASRAALLQAEQTLQQLRTAEPSPLADDGQLLPPWQTAVRNLPQALAIDLIHELSGGHPQVALAAAQGLRAVADTKGCLAVVDCLANIPLLDSVAVLQDILANTTDKTLQKAVKKALHRLKARGLVFDADQQPTHTVVVGTVTHRLEKCLASHIDAAGDRVLWMIRTKAFGGYHIAYLIINYGTGIQLAVGLQATKRELPELLARAQEKVQLVELDPAYCQRLVSLAHQMNLDTRTPVPEEFFPLRDIIGEAETPFEQALIYAVLSADDLQEAQAYGDHADDLLALPEFAGWTLPISVVQKYADQLQEVEQSQIVVSSTLKQERINEVQARALEEVLGERTRWLMRLRLEEMAYYLLQTGRRREALWAVAAAQSLATDNLDRLRRNAFAGALLERSLSAAKSRAGSRIIQPFARAPEPQESRRLII